MRLAVGFARRLMPRRHEMARAKRAEMRARAPLDRATRGGICNKCFGCAGAALGGRAGAHE